MFGLSNIELLRSIRKLCACETLTSDFQFTLKSQSWLFKIHNCDEILIIMDLLIVQIIVLPLRQIANVQCAWYMAILVVFKQTYIHMPPVVLIRKKSLQSTSFVQAKRVCVSMNMSYHIVWAANICPTLNPTILQLYKIQHSNVQVFTEPTIIKEYRGWNKKNIKIHKRQTGISVFTSKTSKFSRVYTFSSVF